MTIDKGIIIRNIFYMLTYAFKELKHNNFSRIATEDFENMDNLFAEIIYRGVTSLLKHGLHREYADVCSEIPTCRGKLKVLDSAKNLAQRRLLLRCEYDELSEDCTINRIIKTTLISLIGNGKVSKERRHKLRQVVTYFSAVEQISLKDVEWNHIRFEKNTQYYKMLVYLCYMVYESRLHTTEQGNADLEMFSEDGMNKLFERFVLEYFKRHYPELNPNARYVDWNLERGCEFSLLPQMKTDITLEFQGKTFIIDAKYYGRTLANNFGKKQIHTHNLYQIYSYVTNCDKSHKGNVDGMLLYAKTEEQIVPNGNIVLGDGNRIYFKTLDLNVEFEGLRHQIDQIVNLLKN